MAGRRAAATASLGLIAAVLFAGCSRTQEPPAPWPTLSSPEESLVPTASASTPPLPPAKPEAAYPGTRAGAQEFVRWYLKAYEYAYANGDASPVRDVATRGCVHCQSVIDRVGKRKAAGQHLVGQNITVTGTSVAPGDTPQHTVVLASFDVTAARLVDASGKTVEAFDAAKKQRLLIALTWEIVAGWRVVGAQFNEGEK